MLRAPSGWLLPWLLLSAASGLAAPDAASVSAMQRAIRSDALLRSLTTELARSFEGMRSVETAAPLYFLGYEARDGRNYSLAASLGAIAQQSEWRQRTLDVDARFGSRELDNTHEVKGPNGWLDFPNVHSTDLPVDDDEVGLRAAVWKATEESLKEALTALTKVQTNKAVTATEEDTSDDFSVEQPASAYRPVSFPGIDEALWRKRLASVSAAVKEYPFVFQSSISLQVSTENRYIVNSEGTRVVDGNTYARLSYSLSSRSEDGMDLERGEAYDADDPRDLPDADRVLRDLRASATELEALRQGPIVEPYTGPAIIRNRAAAVFFHEILGHRLEGHRQKLEREGQTFTKMLGKPVVADFISVVDDPTQERFAGQFLRGFYRFDDEGVPAQRVTLVRDGVLVGFLMGRSPIEGFPRSNGHGRRSAGRLTVARMANTMVEASRTVPYERLHEMLIEELKRRGKPFGYVFYDISGGFTATTRGAPQSFKVLPHLVRRVHADGRPDEIVRGVDIVGTPLTSFGKIVAAADDYAVFNGTCGAESGHVPVSGVAPSILVSEIEIEKRANLSEKPPILPPPHAAGAQP